MRKRFLLPLLAGLSAAPAPAQVTFPGLGDPDGAIGSGSMTLSDDGDDLTIVLNVTTGFNFVPGTLVLYLDARDGGFATTAAFTDDADEWRRAASGLPIRDSLPGRRAEVTFPEGFTADHAIVIANGGTSVLVLDEGDPHRITAFSEQDKEEGAGDRPGTVTSVVPLSTFGSPEEITFVSTYVDARSSARTDESHSEAMPSAPGFETYAFTETATYRVGGSSSVRDAFAAAGVELVGAHPIRDGAAVLRNGSASAADVALYDLGGRRLRSLRLGAGVTEAIDVSDLPAGAYVLRVGGAARRIVVE